VAEIKSLVEKGQPLIIPGKHVPIGIDEACKIIGKAKPTIYDFVRKGILSSYKKGKKLYFYEDELLARIENGRKNTSEQNYNQMLASMQNGYVASRNQKAHNPHLLICAKKLN
jgi:excisionase family DNA binding protein